MAERTCARIECATVFVARTGNQLFCSRECRWVVERRRVRADPTRLERDLESRRGANERWRGKPERRRGLALGRAAKRLERAAVGTRGKSAWAQRGCVICSAVFMARFRDGTKTCGPGCAKEWARQKRKVRNAASWRVLVVSLLLERDGDCCGVCGGLIDSDATGDLALSVDHVVALSCGGEHHARNLQLTHLKCNMEKGVD